MSITVHVYCVSVPNKPDDVRCAACLRKSQPAGFQSKADTITGKIMKAKKKGRQFKKNKLKSKQTINKQETESTGINEMDGSVADDELCSPENKRARRGTLSNQPKTSDGTVTDLSNRTIDVPIVQQGQSSGNAMDGAITDLSNCTIDVPIFQQGQSSGNASGINEMDGSVADDELGSPENKRARRGTLSNNKPMTSVPETADSLETPQYLRSVVMNSDFETSEFPEPRPTRKSDDKMTTHTQIRKRLKFSQPDIDVSYWLMRFA